MPIYSFQCKKCGNKYDAFAAWDKTGEYSSVKCSCGSKKKDKLVTGFSFNFSNPVGTDRYENDHDYRFHHKQKDVRAERAAAEAASHVGPTPYGKVADDLSNSSNFDPLMPQGFDDVYDSLKN